MPKMRPSTPQGTPQAAPHWSHIGETTCVAGMRLLLGIYRLWGRVPLTLCLAPVVFYYYLRQPLARRASAQYLQRLQRATGALPGTPRWYHSLRHLLVFAQTMLDRALAVGGAYPESKVRVEGRDLMVAQLKTGRGAVLVTAHMGCLELCQSLGEHRAGIRLNVLVHTRHARRFNDFMQRLRGACTVHFIEVTELSPALAADLSARVAAGEFVVIAGDRVPQGGQRRVMVPFLGHAAPFAVGPYVLAAAIGCPLMMLTCVHHARGYVVRFQALAQRVHLPRRERHTALQQHAHAFAQALEERLRMAPYDWFNFYPFWQGSDSV